MKKVKSFVKWIWFQIQKIAHLDVKDEHMIQGRDPLATWMQKGAIMKANQRIPDVSKEAKFDPSVHLDLQLPKSISIFEGSGFKTVTDSRKGTVLMIF